jgi:hypothetical protein
VVFPSSERLFPSLRDQRKAAKKTAKNAAANGPKKAGAEAAIQPVAVEGASE